MKQKSWIEPVLERELGRVAAPAGLWENVETPPAQKRRPVFPRWAWALATAALAIASVSVWEGRAGAEIRSSDPGEIRDWVHAKAGLDVPFQAQPPAETRMSGAKLAGANIAEIAFAVGDAKATLRVERASVEVSGHGSLVRGATGATWVLHGQKYTLTCSSPEALHTACRLCHG